MNIRRSLSHLSSCPRRFSKYLAFHRFPAAAVRNCHYHIGSFTIDFYSGRSLPHAAGRAFRLKLFAVYAASPAVLFRLRSINCACTISTAKRLPLQSLTLLSNVHPCTLLNDKFFYRKTCSCLEPRTSSLKNVHPCTFLSYKFAEQTCFCLKPPPSVSVLKLGGASPALLKIVVPDTRREQK